MMHLFYGKTRIGVHAALDELPAITTIPFHASSHDRSQMRLHLHMAASSKLKPLLLANLDTTFPGVSLSLSGSVCLSGPQVLLLRATPALAPRWQRLLHALVPAFQDYKDSPHDPDY